MEAKGPQGRHDDGSNPPNRDHRATPGRSLRRLAMATLCAFAPSIAQAQAAPGARRAERGKESWYFSDYLARKGESARLDALYRFYQGERRKPKPRLEPTIEAFAYTQHAREWDSWGDGRASRGSHRGAGASGEIWANDFVSGLLGIPTLTIVPGVRGERREDTGNPRNTVAVGWGPSLRLFGANQQDSALFATYRNTRRSVLGQPYDGWAWDAGGRLYLFPFLAAEGEAVLDEGSVRGKPSRLAARSGFRGGGYLEWGIVRAGFRFAREEYRLREGGARLREDRREIVLGLSY